MQIFSALRRWETLPHFLRSYMPVEWRVQLKSGAHNEFVAQMSVERTGHRGDAASNHDNGIPSTASVNETEQKEHMGGSNFHVVDPEVQREYWAVKSLLR